MDATNRAANVATYGDSNEKEARSLRLISQALREDGRLACHKSFEGAHADFCVYRKDKPGSPALGAQLKTTGGNRVLNGTTYEYYQFSNTDGYAGLFMIFMALTDPCRIWIGNGSRVVTKGVKIAVKRVRPVRREATSDELREVDLTTVAGDIYAMYMEAVSGIGNYVLRSPEEHEKPTSRARMAEYIAFQHLQRSLPVLFIHPPAEHMSYDYLVGGEKWQLKLAQKNEKKMCTR